MTAQPALLHPDDPQAVTVENPQGNSDILFVSDHAGRAIPRQLGTLGLAEDELARHIGHDIGIYGVTTRLARSLNAAYIYQPYSRLVIDCNRQPGQPQSIVVQSDGTVVPANADLDPQQVRAREAAILRPYQDQIAHTLQARVAKGQPTALFAMHSCTNQLRMDPRPRPWQICVIADSDWRIGTALIEVLRTETSLCVGVNEPYTVNMAMDYTIPVHAEAKGLPYVEIEIRQDLIGDDAGQQEWATLLTRLFPLAIARSGIFAR